MDGNCLYVAVFANDGIIERKLIMKDSTKSDILISILIVLCAFATSLMFYTLVHKDEAVYSANTKVVCYEGATKSINNRTWCQLVEVDE